MQNATVVPEVYASSGYLDLLKRVVQKVKDPRYLMQFREGTRRASEQEYMITETIHAALINLKQNGHPFSFATDNARHGFSGGGLVDNGSASRTIVNEGLIEEVWLPTNQVKKPSKDAVRESGKILVWFPTQKLLEKIAGFLQFKKR
jgi:hypothetical protein